MLKRDFFTEFFSGSRHTLGRNSNPDGHETSRHLSRRSDVPNLKISPKGKALSDTAAAMQSPKSEGAKLQRQSRPGCLRESSPSTRKARGAPAAAAIQVLQLREAAFLPPFALPPHGRGGRFAKTRIAENLHSYVLFGAGGFLVAQFVLICLPPSH